MDLNKRPLIGISCRMDVDGDQFYLRKHYSEAVFHAGGIPVLLPLIPQEVFAQQLVRGLDGIVISGSSSDVDPHRYGREPHPKLGSIMTRRDQTDLFLLEEIFRARKPLLGICFGTQIINVYFGGTLWQDVESQVKGAVKHRQNSVEEYRSHSIRIEPKSMLFEMARQKELRVNSYHHQAIENVARALKPVATAPDGIVEAVELCDNRQFMLGVQWHPEIGWEKDKLSQKIFSRFVSAATSRRPK